MTTKEVFKGIKVADFAWVGVGPQISRVLAEHGATVVRVESHLRPDSLRFSGPFYEGKPALDRSAFGICYHTNKYGISIDINHPKGQEVAKKLIEWADVVTESFTPGTMKKWGLDYENVIKFKPDIVYYSTCQQGQTGPHAQFGGYGTHAASVAGFYMRSQVGPTADHPWYMAHTQILFHHGTWQQQ